MDKAVIIVAGGRDFGNRRIPGQGQDSAWYTECFGRMRTVLKWLVPQIKGEDDYAIIRHGAAKGADEMAASIAIRLGARVQPYPANWDKYGKRAGLVRNAEMTKGATALIAFWDGQSPGTRHMIQTALEAGLEVHVIRYAPQETE